MTGARLSTANEKISVKRRSNRLDEAAIQLSVPNCRETASGDENCTALKNSGSQNCDKLSTRGLVSALGYAWDLANRPLSIPLSGKGSTIRNVCGQDERLVYYSADEGNFQVSASVDGRCSPSYCSEIEHSVREVQENHECLEVSVPSYENYAISRYLCAGAPSKLREIYSWMSEVPVPKLSSSFSLVQDERRMGNSYRACGLLANSCNAFLFAEPIFTLSGISSTWDDNLQSCSDVVSCKTSEAAPESISLQGRCIEAAGCLIQTSRTGEDCQGTNLDSVDKVSQCSTSTLHDSEKNVRTNPSEADFSELKFSLPKEKQHYGIAKQEHAFAGAMAGVLVSLCLHPIDTIKTVIQSCHADVKPLHNIFRTIIAEKGISGLYRGISSNILCSAPISAVYTFTYETVKKRTLPLFPKEYCSLAHCTAGGCASIATSFIFTPSERVKQQMQARSCYRNCWNALIQILKNGGLPSLYTGWGAVLCRNIPHSVIKFYSYENLKKTILPSFQSDPRKNTAVTLICGGLAGSTASLFTTPFDVVKTRLQTQIPGSISSGVFATLTDIGKQEGLRGLYRGLTPRFIMYMIHGALFFTSYESFKMLLSLELPH